MGRMNKLGTPQGVAEWKNLENAGDVKRFLKWCILSVRDQSLDVRTASTLGLLGCYLLKAMEVDTLDSRLTAIEQKLALPSETTGHYDANGTTTTH